MTAQILFKLPGTSKFEIESRKETRPPSAIEMYHENSKGRIVPSASILYAGIRDKKVNKVTLVPVNDAKYVWSISDTTLHHWENNLPSSYSGKQMFARRINDELKKRFAKRFPGKNPTKQFLTSFAFFEASELERVISHANDMVADVVGRDVVYKQDYDIIFTDN